jgi:ABC-type amino acid transport substrate-binding protein
MKSDHRRQFILGLAALAVTGALPSFAAAQAELELHRPGMLRIAVYADFPPYSSSGKGVEIELGKALAARLNLLPDIVEFVADEDMGDDLRNMVWRGHWRGTQNMGHAPADVMLHVPVNQYFASKNSRVAIFGPYHLETVAIARNPEQVPAPRGSTDQAFEAFLEHRIGAEVDTHPSDFLLHVMQGRIRNNVVHYRSIATAIEALRDGEIAAVMATRTQLEGALHGVEGFAIDNLNLPEMRITAWPLGMAVKAENTALAAALASALQDLQRSGEVERIFAEHGLTNVRP